MTDVPVVVADTTADIPANLTPGDLVLTRSSGAFGHVSGGEPPIRKLATVDDIPADAAIGDLFLVGTKTYEVQAAAPATVTAPTMSQPTSSYTTIAFSWYGATGNVARYLLTVDNQPAVDVEGTSYQVSGFTPGTSHTAYVTAQGVDGSYSEPSGSVTTATLRDGIAPTITLGTPLAGELTGPTVRFRFTVTDTESGVQGAQIYWGDTLIESAGSFGGDVWGADLSLTRLRAIGLLSYRVRAVDWSGNVSWSPSVEVSIAEAPVEDTTPPVGEITDPVAGFVIRRETVTVKIAARTTGPAISSVFLRTTEYGEIAPAALVSPGIWQAEVPVGEFEYGDNAVFARITNVAGVYTDTAKIILKRPIPQNTETGYFEIAPPILNAGGEPVRNAELLVNQRMPFDNQDGRIARSQIVVEVRDSEFYIGGIKRNIRVAFPQLNKGISIIEQGSDLAYNARVVDPPEGTLAGAIVPYRDLVDKYPVDEISDVALAPGVVEVLAAAVQVADDRKKVAELVESIGAPTLTYTTDAKGYVTITFGV